MKPARLIAKPYKLYVVSNDGWDLLFTGPKRMTPAEARDLADKLLTAAIQMEAREVRTA